MSVELSWQRAEKILDFKALSSGKSQSRVCVNHLSCELPAENVNHNSSVNCQFDEVGGCEDLTTCLVNLPKRPELSLSMALQEKSGIQQKCKNNTDEHVLTASHSGDPEKYTAVCIKNLTCNEPSGQPKNYPFVACLPLPQTKKALHTDGKEYDFDVCPENDKCLAKQIEVKLENDFLKHLAASRKAAVADTVPRGSAAAAVGQASSTTSAHRGKK